LLSFRIKRNFVSVVQYRQKIKFMRPIFWSLLYVLAFPVFGLGQVETPSLSVYYFLAEDCVICQQYTSYLNTLFHEYAGEEVEMIGYFPNSFSKKQKIAAFQQKYQVAMPLKTDYFQTKAQQFQIRVTPEVVVFDHVNQLVLYQGRIDNTFYKLGRRRRVTTTNDLEEVLIAWKKGEPITPQRTEPIGCLITQKKHSNTNHK